MPNWAGKWKGGRFYLDEGGRRIFFIERRVGGRQRAIKLRTHDEDLANSELTRFMLDPEAFQLPSAIAVAVPDPVYVTKERIKLYLESIRSTVADHRAARASQLSGWSTLGIDLRTADFRTLRTALGSFDGGHRGRAEALNAFCRFLVKLGDLATWKPIVNHVDPEATRAEREAYSLEQLAAAFKALPSQAMRDLFFVRAATGMHHTEIAQLKGARVTAAALPDKGVAVRKLGGDHVIQGVVQIVHRKKHRKERRHRVSVDEAALRAVLRLSAGVPDRMATWKTLEPLGIVPSNLRHTFVTLSGEIGELVTYTGTGVARARIAQAIGHRAGSTMTEDRYDKLQIPPMIRIPLPFSPDQVAEVVESADLG